jgi:hypothetical protein
LSLTFAAPDLTPLDKLPLNGYDVDAHGSGLRQMYSHGDRRGAETGRLRARADSVFAYPSE